MVMPVRASTSSAKRTPRHDPARRVSRAILRARVSAYSHSHVRDSRRLHWSARKRNHRRLVVGSVIGLEAMFAGAICGASMNPARSLAPALVSGQLSALWLYLLAPIAGAAAAVLACRCAQEQGCCSAAMSQDS